MSEINRLARRIEHLERRAGKDPYLISTWADLVCYSERMGEHPARLSPELEEVLNTLDSEEPSDEDPTEAERCGRSSEARMNE